MVLWLLLRDHAHAPGVWNTDAGHTSLSKALEVMVVIANVTPLPNPPLPLSRMVDDRHNGRLVRTQTDFNHAHTKKQTHRMLRHVKYYMNCGFKSVMIRTVDTDVVLLDVAH